MSNALVKQTQEIMKTMSDISIGRISAGWDADTDFDALPAHLADISKEDVESAELFQGEGEDESLSIDASLAAAPDTTPTEFEPPLDHFPTFRKAFRHFTERAPKSRAVRIDTEKSYGGFGVEKAVKEIERRTQDLRAAIEQHLAEKHGGATKPMRVWDEVLGAVSAIKDISKAKDAKEAIEKLPQVPLTVPEDVKDKVKCWQDGEAVVVSMHFAMPDGSPRIATMGRKPEIDEESIVEWAEGAGYDPVTILGAAPAIASVATGKRLVRETAAAALEAQGHSDVVELDEDCEEPIILVGLGENTAPLAALMYVQQQADAGNAQAQRELTIMQEAAKTPMGRKIAAPVLAEARRRLAQGREEKQRESFADQYAKLSAFV